MYKYVLLLAKKYKNSTAILFTAYSLHLFHTLNANISCAKLRSYEYLFYGTGYYKLLLAKRDIVPRSNNVGIP